MKKNIDPFLDRLGILTAIHALADRCRRETEGGREIIVVEEAGWELPFLKNENSPNILITREKERMKTPPRGTLILWDKTEEI